MRNLLTRAAGYMVDADDDDVMEGLTRFSSIYIYYVLNDEVNFNPHYNRMTKSDCAVS